MQKTDTTQATSVHRKVGVSTTLNRRYVRRPQPSSVIAHFNDRPVKKAMSIKIEDDADRELQKEIGLGGAEQLSEAIEQEAAEMTRQEQMVSEVEQDLAPVAPEAMHPVQIAALERMRWQKQQQQQAEKMSAKEIKDREIKKALATTAKKIDKEAAEREKTNKRAKLHFGIARVMLAISCTAAALMAIVYFVSTNMPDISMRVTAIQSGINASYPGYVPRGYSMTDLSSEDGRVTMNFVNNETGGRFTLVEENSSWDSSALLANYVKSEMGENYTIVREQGLTIYASDSEATWVNGGVVYKLKATSGELTKKQIKSIAVSM